MIAKRLAPRWVTAAAAVAALAACSQSGVVVSRVDQAPSYDPMEVRVAGGGDRQLPVIVIGNPFPEPEATVEAALVQGMQRTPTGVRVNFTTEPTNTDPQRPYRVVLVFNPARTIGAGDICKRQDDLPPDEPPGEGRVALMGVLCSTDYALSRAKAQAPVTHVASPAFDAMVSQLTFAMFPVRNRHRQIDGLDFGAPVIP